MTLARQHVQQLHRMMEQIEALKRAWQTAMYRTGSTRIPECGRFGEIAQDLDFVLSGIGVKK